MESEIAMTQPTDPQEALASIQSAREKMLQTMETYPAAYDWLFALGAGVLVAWPGLPGDWTLFVAAFAFGYAFWAQRWWKKRYGWWVDAYSPKKARWIAIGMSVAIAALMIGSLWGREHGPWWFCLVMGALAVPVTVIGARWWAAVWKRELRGEV